MGDTPPTEFRIFKAGANATTKGTFMFTAASAAKIMAEYARCGVDMMIDLEHEALAGDEVAARADARDARGWFTLELRRGDLWAANVRWAPDGARRLAERTQRYISPAFVADPKTHEIVDLVNCALVGMPATHGTAALVAASKTSIDTVNKIASALLKLRASKSRVRLGVKS